MEYRKSNISYTGIKGIELWSGFSFFLHRYEHHPPTLSTNKMQCRKSKIYSHPSFQKRDSYGGSKFSSLVPRSHAKGYE
ncbi:unnamed protein product [Echinostoma caproni]|uniref:Ovule protein n=1 Tax=Echinostoma caproni TaxID=27848 RepID=A0A183BEH8_9TREM|nr:unnamed protein product [Echinostoma caproni]